MKTENYSYQPLSSYIPSYNDDPISLGYISPSSTCSSSSLLSETSSCSSYSSSSSSSLTAPEPEFDDQKIRNNIIQHLVSKPKPKKQYQCPQCLKSFTRPSALQTHSYTHTNEKPFQCQSPNCGRSFSVVSNLRRHFKVHQKAAIGDKLSAEDRLRCVRNLMKRSDKILATKKQISQYTSIALSLPPQQQQRNQSLYPLPPLLPQPQPQTHYPRRLILPDLNINNNNNFTLHDANQNMAALSDHTTSTSSSNLSMYYFNQFGAPNTNTASTKTTINNYSTSYGGNSIIF